MKTILILIFLCISSLGFGQIKKLNDSTYTLSKVDMDKLYTLMVDWETLDTLAKRYVEEIKLLKEQSSLKDSVIEKKDTIIVAKDRALTNAQNILNEMSLNQTKFWQGLNVGLRIESPDDIQLKDIDYRSLKYSIGIDAGLNIGKFTLNPGMELFLSGQKPKYFINLKYKIF